LSLTAWRSKVLAPASLAERGCTLCDSSSMTRKSK
jgi:hypothetical protein